MKEIGIDELRLIQLDMLNDIHAFCMDHQINYSLAFGTLLGAVRHKGYIPWDDDVDIMMPREDYNRFIRSYGNQIYKIADMFVNPDYVDSFAKVEDTRTVIEEYEEGGSFVFGVYIDVFPVDYVPDNLSERKAFYKKKRMWNVLYELKRIKVKKGRSFVKNLALMVGHRLLFFISRRQLAHKLSELASKYQGQKTTFMGIVAPADSRIEEAVPSNCFEEYIELPFENINVMSIKNYDCYLSAAFGDYMQLPPEEKRVSHHVFKAYWR